jgi:hypothetical protein
VESQVAQAIESHVEIIADIANDDQAMFERLISKINQNLWRPIYRELEYRQVINPGILDLFKQQIEDNENHEIAGRWEGVDQALGQALDQAEEVLANCEEFISQDDNAKTFAWASQEIDVSMVAQTPLLNLQSMSSNLANMQSRAQELLELRGSKHKEVWGLLQREPWGGFVKALQRFSLEELQGLDASGIQNQEGFTEKMRLWHVDPQNTWKELAQSMSEGEETREQDWEKAALESLVEFCDKGRLFLVWKKLEEFENSNQYMREGLERNTQAILEILEKIEVQMQPLTLLSPRSSRVPAGGGFQSPERAQQRVPVFTPAHGDDDLG